MSGGHGYRRGGKPRRRDRAPSPESAKVNEVLNVLQTTVLTQADVAAKLYEARASAETVEKELSITHRSPAKELRAHLTFVKDQIEKTKQRHALVTDAESAHRAEWEHRNESLVVEIEKVLAAVEEEYRKSVAMLDDAEKHLMLQRDRVVAMELQRECQINRAKLVHGHLSEVLKPPLTTNLVTMVHCDVPHWPILKKLRPKAWKVSLDAIFKLYRSRPGCYEVRRGYDSVIYAFKGPEEALKWCFDVQEKLMTLDWPVAIVHTSVSGEIYAEDEDPMEARRGGKGKKIRPSGPSSTGLTQMGSEAAAMRQQSSANRHHNRSSASNGDVSSTGAISNRSSRENVNNKSNSNINTSSRGGVHGSSGPGPGGSGPGGSGPGGPSAARRRRHRRLLFRGPRVRMACVSGLVETFNDPITGHVMYKGANHQRAVMIASTARPGEIIVDDGCSIFLQEHGEDLVPDGAVWMNELGEFDTGSGRVEPLHSVLPGSLRGRDAHYGEIGADFEDLAADSNNNNNKGLSSSSSSSSVSSSSPSSPAPGAGGRRKRRRRRTKPRAQDGAYENALGSTMSSTASGSSSISSSTSSSSSSCPSGDEAVEYYTTDEEGDGNNNAGANNNGDGEKKDEGDNENGNDDDVSDEMLGRAQIEEEAAADDEDLRYPQESIVEIDGKYAPMADEALAIAEKLVVRLKSFVEKRRKMRNRFRHMVLEFRTNPNELLSFMDRQVSHYTERVDGLVSARDIAKEKVAGVAEHMNRIRMRWYDEICPKANRIPFLQREIIELIKEKRTARKAINDERVHYYGQVGKIAKKMSVCNDDRVSVDESLDNIWFWLEHRILTEIGYAI